MISQKDMHWSDVKAALEKSGSSLATIAANLGVSNAAITKIKHRPCARIQDAIAKALEKKPAAIWPTRYYHSNGSPIRPSIWMLKNI